MTVPTEDAPALREISDVERAALLQFTRDGAVEFANAAATTLFGNAAGAADPELVLVEPDGRTIDLRDLLQLVMHGGGPVHIESSQYAIHAVPVHAKGTVSGAVLAIRDISENRRSNALLEWKASHDELTGLLNRGAFAHELQRVEEDVANGEIASLIFIDLNRFKHVNDTAGHHAGDELLRQVASLFSRHARKQDVIARLGGDEFCVLLPRASVSDACEMAARIKDVIEAFRFSSDGRSYAVGAAFGVAGLAPGEGSGRRALELADGACRRAKTQGANPIEIGTDREQGLIVPRDDAYWSQCLVDASDGDGLLAEFEEIAAIDPARASRWELKVLLRDRAGGLIHPRVFVPAAERYGTVQQLDRWSVEQALDFAIRSRPPATVRLHVNVSPVSLADAAFFDWCRSRLSADATAASRLAFEVPETAAFSYLATVLRFAEMVRALGAQVFLDDFGIGSSAFAYLRTMPVDGIKIDGRLVQAIGRSDVERAIVRAIGTIAATMNLITIAESATDARIFDLLRVSGLDYAQGAAFRTGLRADALAGVIGSGREV